MGGEAPWRRVVEQGGRNMKIAIVGSRYFGAQVFEALRKEEGVEFSSVVAPAADDRLALAAQASANRTPAQRPS